MRGSFPLLPEGKGCDGSFHRIAHLNSFSFNLHSKPCDVVFLISAFLNPSTLGPSKQKARGSISNAEKKNIHNDH